MKSTASAVNQNSGPMLDQYRRIKREHQGEVLFFRLGDFYEMFAEDALEVSSLLNLTITSRSGQPMCGIPYHAARTYIARLLKFGKKIAICEQITEQNTSRLGAGARGPMERKVVEVITPGTTVEEDYLEKGSSNYLGCFASFRNAFSFAYIDLSAGDFFATSFAKEGAAEQLRQELERLQIKEIIVQESLLEDFPYLAAAVQERSNLVVNRWADWLFDVDRSTQRLTKQFGTASLKGFGLEEDAPEIIAAGALLDYLDDTARSLIPHIRSVSVYKDSYFVGIDEATQRNLELIRNLRNGNSDFTLFEVMDECRTAMGRRLLKSRILHPLRNADLIRSRLDAVDVLYHRQEALSRIREYLGKTPDLERLSSRIAMDRAHGKDMAGVKNALEYFFRIEEECKELKINFESPDAALFDSESGNNDLAQLKELHEILENSLPEDPSILLTEGNLIKSGYDPNLDELHKLRDNGRGLLEEYLEEEKQSTGISSLKIRYNRMIGYYFEVTKNHLAKVPSYFIRRQGIVAGERYTTDRLAELESNINSASDRIVELEKNLFLEIRGKAKSLLLTIIAASRRIAELDAAQSLARAATIHAWNRPVVDNENRLYITEGRHPVVEAHLPRGEFIPNDVILEKEPSVSFALITGPNMAGKSTYLRQAALIMIMAQAGSFVPAREALVGMADRIYCRVGASDNLARGESTFLVEMNETAYILRSATEKSLVIMDEVGRGTGTKDGLSIAWAVCEEILNHIKCRTLFATHYHELSMISHQSMANRSMEISDNEGEIVFLRKLKEGPAAESYGLHVARLAGLPDTVLERAGELMDELNEKIPNYSSSISTTRTNKPERKAETQDNVLQQRLIKIDINALSPLEALNLLSQLKEEALRKPTPIRKNQSDSPGLFD
jgi:DNA mismatch repair protein MutS